MQNKIINIRIKSAHRPTLWYAGVIGADLEVIEHEKDSDYFEAFEDDHDYTQKDTRAERSLILKQDAEIINN